MSNVNNKHSDKSDGHVLSEIAHELRGYLTKYPMAVVVREKALDVQAGPRSSRVIEVLHKVVGISDLYAWAFGGRVFDEIPPQTVKKLVTNDAGAEKDVVASSLEQFVGKQEYACDDESDAVAVGVAWLLQHGKIDSPYAPKEPDPPKKTTRGRRKKG